MWCHWASFSKSGYQTRAPYSPVPSGSQSPTMSKGYDLLFSYGASILLLGILVSRVDTKIALSRVDSTMDKQMTSSLPPL